MEIAKNPKVTITPDGEVIAENGHFIFDSKDEGIGLAELASIQFALSVLQREADKIKEKQNPSKGLCK